MSENEEPKARSIGRADGLVTFIDVKGANFGGEYPSQVYFEVRDTSKVEKVRLWIRTPEWHNPAAFAAMASTLAAAHFAEKPISIEYFNRPLSTGGEENIVMTVFAGKQLKTDGGEAAL